MLLALLYALLRLLIDLLILRGRPTPDRDLELRLVLRLARERGPSGAGASRS